MRQTFKWCEKLLYTHTPIRLDINGHWMSKICVRFLNDNSISNNIQYIRRLVSRQCTHSVDENQCVGHYFDCWACVICYHEQCTCCMCNVHRCNFKYESQNVWNRSFLELYSPFEHLLRFLMDENIYFFRIERNEKWDIIGSVESNRYSIQEQVVGLR